MNYARTNANLPDISYMKYYQLVKFLEHFETSFHPSTLLINSIAFNVDKIDEKSRDYFLKWFHDFVKKHDYVNCNISCVGFMADVLSHLPTKYLSKYIFVKDEYLRNLVIELIKKSE